MRIGITILFILVLLISAGKSNESESRRTDSRGTDSRETVSKLTEGRVTEDKETASNESENREYGNRESESRGTEGRGIENGESARKKSAPGEPAYNAGERLEYQIYYGPLNGGKVLMTLEPVNFGGAEVLHATALGYTTGLADRIFRIYDVYQSFMDPETGLPVKAIRDINEGSYTYYNEVIYNRDSNTVKSQLSGINEVPPGILDLISAIYKLRDTMLISSFRPGDVIEMKTYFSDKVFPISVRYGGTETIRTRMGKFHTLRLYPKSDPGRIFRNEDAITAWFSNDRNFVPLRVSLNMLVGSIRIDLIDYEGLRHELINLQ